MKSAKVPRVGWHGNGLGTRTASVHGNGELHWEWPSDYGSGELHRERPSNYGSRRRQEWMLCQRERGLALDNNHISK